MCFTEMQTFLTLSLVRIPSVFVFSAVKSDISNKKHDFSQLLFNVSENCTFS